MSIVVVNPLLTISIRLLSRKNKKGRLVSSFPSNVVRTEKKKKKRLRRPIDPPTPAKREVIFFKVGTYILNRLHVDILRLDRWFRWRMVARESIQRVGRSSRRLTCPRNPLSLLTVGSSGRSSSSSGGSGGRGRRVVLDATHGLQRGLRRGAIDTRVTRVRRESGG